MDEESDVVLRRMRWVTGCLALLFILWLIFPWFERHIFNESDAPRAVTARGDLAADELATIEIFEQASPSVVFITTRERVRNIWTRNVFSVPSGSGSGFFLG